MNRESCAREFKWALTRRLWLANTYTTTKQLKHCVHAEFKQNCTKNVAQANVSKYANLKESSVGFARADLIDAQQTLLQTIHAIVKTVQT